MTGSSVKIGGVLFGGVPDLAVGGPEERKKGHGKHEKGSSGKDGSKGVKEARVSFLGRIFGSNRQKGKADDRSTGTSNRVSEAPAEFLPVACPDEPSELDSPVISPRPEASGEEESRSLRERLRAAETHKGPGPAGPFHTFEFDSGAGPAGPVHAFESYVIESLTRKQRRPVLDLAALTAASENRGVVEPAERDTWQGGAECDGGDRKGEGAGLPEGSYRADPRTEEGPEATSIRPGGSVDAEGSLRNRGGRHVRALDMADENVDFGERLEQGTCSGDESLEGLASDESFQGAAGTRQEGGQGLEGFRGGEWLAASRPPDQRASVRPKEFDYERRASVEGGGEGRNASQEAASSGYGEASGRSETCVSQSGTLPDPMEGGGGEWHSGNMQKGRRSGKCARGGIEWWPMKDGVTGRSEVVSGGLETQQPMASEWGQDSESPAGICGVRGVVENGLH